jgi:hypothetical protein
MNVAGTGAGFLTGDYRRIGSRVRRTGANAADPYSVVNERPHAS